MSVKMQHDQGGGTPLKQLATVQRLIRKIFTVEIA
jgi:hypothetical protein